MDIRYYGYNTFIIEITDKKLNDPRQSRGLNFASPSKGRDYYPLEGGGRVINSFLW